MLIKLQSLLCYGKNNMLDNFADDKPLSHYKIGDGGKLFLMLKKPGGGITPATSTSTPSQTPVKSPDSASPMVVDHAVCGLYCIVNV